MSFCFALSAFVLFGSDPLTVLFCVCASSQSSGKGDVLPLAGSTVRSRPSRPLLSLTLLGFLADRPLSLYLSLQSFARCCTAVSFTTPGSRPWRGGLTRWKVEWTESRNLCASGRGRGRCACYRTDEGRGSGNALALLMLCSSIVEELADARQPVPTLLPTLPLLSHFSSFSRLPYTPRHLASSPSFRFSLVNRKIATSSNDVPLPLFSRSSVSLLPPTHFLFLSLLFAA